MSDIIPIETIAGRIFLIRCHKVLLDRDLAEGLESIRTEPHFMP